MKKLSAAILLVALACSKSFATVDGASAGLGWGLSVMGVGAGLAITPPIAGAKLNSKDAAMFYAAGGAFVAAGIVAVIFGTLENADWFADSPIASHAVFATNGRRTSIGARFRF